MVNGRSMDRPSGPSGGFGDIDASGQAQGADRERPQAADEVLAACLDELCAQVGM